MMKIQNRTALCNMPVYTVQADAILLPADLRTRHHHSFKFKHILSHTAHYKHSFFVTTVPELNPSWSLRQHGYHHRPEWHAHPIVVIHESGLTTTELELDRTDLKGNWSLHLLNSLPSLPSRRTVQYAMCPQFIWSCQIFALISDCQSELITNPG